MSMCSEKDVNEWTVTGDGWALSVGVSDGAIELCASGKDGSQGNVGLSEQACEQLELILGQARMQAKKQTQIEYVNKLRDLSAAHIRDLQAKEALAPDTKEGE